MSTPDRPRAYARAFYEAAFEGWLAALQDVADRLGKDTTLRQRLAATGAEADQRQALVDGLLPPGADLPVRNLLYTLAQHDDLDTLPDVIAELRQKLSAAGKGPLEVEVVSAVALTDEESQALRARLQEQFGGELDIHYRIDPAILGGMIVRAGDKLIDGSLAARLAGMRQVLGVRATA